MVDPRKVESGGDGGRSHPDVAKAAREHESSTGRIEAARERSRQHTSLPEWLDVLSARIRSLTRRWPWLGYWEFWLALVVGAFLRLWQLGSSQFLDDQAMLMSMARASVLRHAIPITGIPSSIGVLNPPLSVYLLIPFALFGKDPAPAIIGIALWNVIGVALCYVFAWRFFNRRVAAIGTLLFATSIAAVDFSRFLWQQNYLPPLLILWALATFAGAVRGSRGWFFAGVVLLALALLLHPTALLLLPVLAVAFVLAPRKPDLWEYVAIAAALLVLVAPTLIWEYVSGGFDVRMLQQYTSAPPQVNLDVLRVMEQVLGPPIDSAAVGPTTFAPPTASSPYAAIAGWAPILWYLACAVYGVSYAIVTGLVVAPIARRWQSVSHSPAGQRRGGFRIVEVWRTLRADQAWRVHLLLWLGVTFVPLAMIRHSSRVHAHYLHVLYPLIFILAGVGIDWLLKWLRLHRPSLRLTDARRAHTLRLARTALAVGGVAALIAGQTLQSGLYIASQATGQVSYANYGYPVGELRAADAELTTLQRQQEAVATYISAPIFSISSALTYMLVSERADRTLVYGNCLVLPPSGSPPVLVVSTDAQSPVAGLLPQLPTARLVRTLPMPGNEPFLVYRVQGGAPALPHERLLPNLIFQDGFGNTMRLDGAVLENDTTLRLRWTVLRMASSAGASRRFYVDARAVRSGVETDPAIAHVECDPTRWQDGATIFTWVSTAAVTLPAQPVAPLPGTVAISAWDQVVYYATPVRHGLRLLTSNLVYQLPAQLLAMNPPPPILLPAGMMISHGELVAPSFTLSSP